eukprot:15355247-Ditylum_brightwellii.AAC.1
MTCTRKKSYVNGGSCPDICAVPVATDGLCQQPNPQMRPCQWASPRKTGVVQKGGKWEGHL